MAPEVPSSEAYCYRSYCYNMQLDPGQQAPPCRGLPEEVHQKHLPEADVLGHIEDSRYPEDSPTEVPYQGEVSSVA